VHARGSRILAGSRNSAQHLLPKCVACLGQLWTTGDSSGFSVLVSFSHKSVVWRIWRCLHQTGGNTRASWRWRSPSDSCSSEFSCKYTHYIHLHLAQYVKDSGKHDALAYTWLN